MRRGFLLAILFFSAQAQATAYLGGSYGLGDFTSPELKDRKASLKGNSYGGFFGVGKAFLGLEGFYTALNTTGKIKHENQSYDMKSNTQAFGAAMRVSFEIIYLRLGLARFNLDQSIDMPSGTSHQAADKIYNIQDGTSKGGLLFGIGMHKKIGPGRAFVDFARYQITDIGHYDTFSVGYAFTRSDSWLPTLAGDKD